MFATKALKRTPRELKGTKAKKKPVCFVLHSFVDRKETSIPDDISEDITSAELLYKFNKGFHNTRITLAQNPKFYFGQHPPYNTPELLGMEQHLGGSSSAIPRKLPLTEQGLSNVLRGNAGLVIIHVYFDWSPYSISVEHPEATWAFSLAKWNVDRTPQGIFKDQDGVLYDGIHLKRLIPEVPVHDDIFKQMMKPWIVLRSTTTGRLVNLDRFWHLDFWNEVSPDDPFSRWCLIFLEHLVKAACNPGILALEVPVTTQPGSIPRVKEPCGDD
ncbi:hypothetical protein FRC07_005063, partial [Ceratobasidium sp. 392]